MRIVRETTLTVEKKSFALVLCYIGSMSLKTRIQLTKSLKKSSIQKYF